MAPGLSSPAWCCSEDTATSSPARGDGELSSVFAQKVTWEQLPCVMSKEMITDPILQHLRRREGEGTSGCSVPKHAKKTLTAQAELLHGEDLIPIFLCKESMNSPCLLPRSQRCFPRALLPPLPAWDGAGRGEMLPASAWQLRAARGPHCAQQDPQHPPQLARCFPRRWEAPGNT